MTDKIPIAASEDGLVYGFMDKVDFEEELGMAADGNSIYPSAEILKERHPCCNTCGIIKVSVGILDEDPPKMLTREDDKFVVTKEEGRRWGYMDHQSLFFELGIADMGSRVFPSRDCCEDEEGRRTEAGVYPVEVLLVEVIQEPKREKSRRVRSKDLKYRREPQMSCDPYPMLLDLACRLRQDLEAWNDAHWGEDYSGPRRCHPPYLINVLNNIEKYCEEIDTKPDDLLALCKMHRGIGHVRTSMVMLGIITWDEIREHFYQARIAFPEVPDDELRAHLDPDSGFRLDIGGEG